MEKPEKVIPQKVIGFGMQKTSFVLTSEKARLYNISIGYSEDPLKKSDLAFTYELSDEFKINPTFATCFNKLEVMFECLQDCPGIPEFNPMLLLHGEQSTSLQKPLEVDTTYYMKGAIVDVQDKKSGALIILQTQGYEDEQMTNMVFDSYMNIFIRGIGKFENDKPKYKTWIRIPKIKNKPNPKFQLKQKTQPNQAILYRLNSDDNPLHIDPDMAAMGNFPKPILHGLCTYAISGKLMLEKLCNNDVSMFKNLSGRFTSHVFPGETLLVSVWQMDNKKYYFETTTEERGKVVLMGTFEIKNPIQPKL